MKNQGRDFHEPFSISRMKGSLVVFGAGKLISAIVGIAWLLLLVRILDVPSYGGYITLLALLEITSLLSNAGVYSFAQRYLTEARLPNNVSHLPWLLWASLFFRILTLCCVLVVLGLFDSKIATWLQQDKLTDVLLIYGFVIVFEGGARYLEIVFEALLEQGKAQVSVLARNFLRVVVIYFILVNSGSVSLHDVVLVELFTSVLGFTIAVCFSWVVSGVGRGEYVQESRGESGFGLRRIVSFCLPMYMAQCFFLIYSPDMIKIVVSRLLGAVEAAAFGFAHAVSFVLQRYLPASLLLGLIRPMLVARRAHANNDDQLIAVGNIILKINIFLLLPVVVFLAICGDDFSNFLSGGKFSRTGRLMFLLTLLLVPMGLHVVMSMLATAVEDRRAVLLGTFSSIPGIFVGILLSEQLGTTAMALGLWVSELSWCFMTHQLLRRSGFEFKIDWGAWSKLFFAALVSGCAVAVLLRQIHGGVHLQLAVAMSAILLVYLVVVWLVKPFTVTESAMFGRLMPARFGKLFFRC